QDADANLYIQNAGDGMELVLQNMTGICIRGAKDKKTEIVVEPRYAEVLTFLCCEDIRLENLTIGHTVEEGYCSGGVLYFDFCDQIDLDQVELYGCGTYGIIGNSTTNLTVWDSNIHNCTYGIIDLAYCSNVTFVDTVMERCKDLTMIDLNCSCVRFEGCSFRDNKGDQFVGNYFGNSVIFENCSFDKWEAKSLSMLEPGASGIIIADNCEFSGSKVPQTATYVSNVKELVEAIKPDAVIRLKRGNYNISEYISAAMADNGGHISDYVSIEEVYDGYELHIEGVDNLSIIGGGNDPQVTKLLVDPRYATTMTFEECTDLYLSGMMMGHTNGDGFCSGNVINLIECTNVTLHEMDLFGCGATGLDADEISSLAMYDSVIHDCSDNPVCFYDTKGRFVFVSCTFLNCNGSLILDQNGTDYSFIRCTFGEMESDIAYADPDTVSLNNCIFNVEEDFDYYEDYGYDWEESVDEDIRDMDLAVRPFGEYDFATFEDYWCGYQVISAESELTDEDEFYPPYTIDIFENHSGSLNNWYTDEEIYFEWSEEEEGIKLSFIDGDTAILTFFELVEPNPYGYNYYLQLKFDTYELWFY
ncbi:MAG: right-handed parallel beta-helix repeat-containing protein, partial [Lachnospiraceae bacterium]|nr:right-handed parallel beta-helix repeat-containing protein [Lachnospiraceae bacterium]